MQPHEQPLISVIVPCYNVEKYVEQCLHSLVRQTYKNLQIICVNDGSTDKTKDVLDEYDFFYGNIYIIDKPNGGLSSARNAGLNKAYGQLITFVDSDDFLLPDTLSRAAQSFMSDKDLDLYVYGMEAFTEGPSSQDIAAMNAWFKRRIDTNLSNGTVTTMTYKRAQNTNIHVCNKVFKDRLIGRTRFIEGLLYEDIYFMWSCFFKCNKVKYDDFYGYRYRIHSNSIMEKTTKDKNFERAVHHIKNWVHLAEDSIAEDTFFDRQGFLFDLLSKLADRTKEMSPECFNETIDAYCEALKTRFTQLHNERKN